MLGAASQYVVNQVLYVYSRQLRTGCTVDQQACGDESNEVAKSHKGKCQKHKASVSPQEERRVILF